MHNVLYKLSAQCIIQTTGTINVTGSNVFEMFKGIAKVYMNMITDDIHYKIL